MSLKRWMALAALGLSLGALAACQPAADDAGGAVGDQAAGGGATAPADAGAAVDTPAAAEQPMTGDVGTAADPLVMSFVPSGETEQITASADKIAELLGAETGLTIKTNVATSYAAVIEAMGAGNAHVAWLPTLSYILAHEKYDVRPILVVGRFGTTTYASQIIAKAGGGVTSIADLKGKSFCRPDALSTSGWVVPSVTMKAAGLDPDVDLDKIIDAGGHDGVVTAVYKGDCAAGATFVDARGQIEEEYPDVMDVVTVVATSDTIPNDNVSVIASLPEGVVQAIKDGLLAIGKTEEGAEALSTVYGVETLEPADDSFYDAFRVTLDKAGVEVDTLISE